MARGLLILFHPFENEMKEIHEKDVIELYNTLKKDIEKKRSSFEKHKTLQFTLHSATHTPTRNSLIAIDSLKAINGGHFPIIIKISDLYIKLHEGLGLVLELSKRLAIY